MNEAARLPQDILLLKDVQEPVAIPDPKYSQIPKEDQLRLFGDQSFLSGGGGRYRVRFMEPSPIDFRPKSDYTGHIMPQGPSPEGPTPDATQVTAVPEAEQAHTLQAEVSQNVDSSPTVDPALTDQSDLPEAFAVEPRFDLPLARLRQRQRVARINDKVLGRSRTGPLRRRR